MQLKKIIGLVVVLFFAFGLSFAATKKDSLNTYKKRVLESTEIDLLMSYYKQDGDHSSVGGGIGTEELTNTTPTIVISIPLNDDDVLTIDAGLSAYTSASSSNINPFNSSGASRGGDDDDEHGEDHDDDDGYNQGTIGTPTGTPWLASSGASKSDALVSVSADYSHSSDNRNFIWGLHGAFSQEYDYHSIGFGGNLVFLFNEKNTEFSLKTQVYLDNWRPIYPTELHEYSRYGNDFLHKGYFNGVDVYNQNGAATNQYKPELFSAFTDKKRNSYSASFSISQILGQRLQASFFFDLIYQEGLLSTPYHRIYFADKPNYYIGEKTDIPRYTSPQNKGVFQLADNVEQLPGTRLKTPFGLRVNYYLSETFKLRTYYRYYTDDWGIGSHTASIEVPVKLSQRFALIPAYRYYEQTEADYFAPFETHLSTEEFYTSDHDLAKFNSNQWSIGLRYTDIFSDFKIINAGLKNINVNFSHYSRSDGLKSNIISFGIKFALQ